MPYFFNGLNNGVLNLINGMSQPLFWPQVIARWMELWPGAVEPRGCHLAVTRGEIHIAGKLTCSDLKLSMQRGFCWTPKGRGRWVRSTGLKSEAWRSLSFVIFFHPKMFQCVCCPFNSPFLIIHDLLCSIIGTLSCQCLWLEFHPPTTPALLI